MAEITQHGEGKPVKFTLTKYRKEGIEHESFMEWIVKVHFPKAFPVLKKHGITGYALVSFPRTKPYDQSAN
jgi:hypothetical protein